MKKTTEINIDDDYAKIRYKVFKRHSEQLGSYAMSWSEFKIAYNKKGIANLDDVMERTKQIEI